MSYRIYCAYFKIRHAVYYFLPMWYLRKKYKRLSALERAMLRHPAKVSADTYDRVADNVSSLVRVITYSETNRWTKSEVVEIVKGFGWVFLFFLVMGIIGGIE